MHSLLIWLVMMAAALPALAEEEDAFTIHLPAVKPAYPGAEYWAQIQFPDGKTSIWAFAVFGGRDNWTVPVRTDMAGDYRLLRVEKRQGGTRAEVVLGTNSQRQLSIRHPRRLPGSGTNVLVETGPFQAFFVAEEPWCVNDHTLVRGPDKTWHLFGITHRKPLDFFKDPGRMLAHATAGSLLERPWQAQAPAVTADWEHHQEHLLWAPHVLRDWQTYYMFVCVGDKQTHRYRLHLLTSPDLKTWTRHPDNPLLIDGFDARDPMVMRIQDQWVMYYTATSTPEGGNYVVACVTSRDLIHWADRRVVFVHPRVGTFGGPTESPFVVRRGHHCYLFVCDNDWTDVYLSSDPFHWEFGRRAGRIHSHASEIVRDVDGRWYISHAGWMNGPVCLAPLQWHDGLDDAPTNVAAGSP